MTTQTPASRDQSSADGSGGRGPTSDRATPGTVVGGRYELRSAIGNGGMGTVWRATDSLLRREVAVKEVLLPQTMPKSEREALCERTLREARAAAALSHPSVVQVYDVVTDGGRPWIVMELLEARSLADMVIDDGPLAARAVAKIGIAMLGALEVAHAAGVLHRDVKPANVLICNDGRCVLTDFGVARLPTESKLTTPGMVLGSPHFISPERAVGGAFGPPSDLFSLGVTLYTAIEGGPPFDRGDPFETMRAVVEEAPRPARLAGPLQPVLWGLLEKEPSRRWTVDQARAVLRELLSGTLSRSTHARLDTDPYAVVRPPDPPAPPPRRERQVGGRAMLDPDEPLSGQLARLRAAAGAGGGGATPPSPLRAVAAPGAPRREGTGRRRAPSSGAVRLDQFRDRARRVRHVAGRAAARPRSRVIVGAGLVAVLLLVCIGALVVWRGGDEPSNQPAPPAASADASAPVTAAPLIEVQEYQDQDRGIALNVPAGWEQSGNGSYVDYTEPDSTRRVRINVESAGATAEKFLEEAEKFLMDRPNSCAPPYQRVALIEAPLADETGAQLEYTCGEGDAKRHGLWRAVVQDKKAYHFYLSVPEARFADSKIIFDEMVRSFRFV